MGIGVGVGCWSRGGVLESGSGVGVGVMRGKGEVTGNCIAGRKVIIIAPVIRL